MSTALSNPRHSRKDDLEIPAAAQVLSDRKLPTLLFITQGVSHWTSQCKEQFRFKMLI